VRGTLDILGSPGKGNLVPSLGHLNHRISDLMMLVPSVCSHPEVTLNGTAFVIILPSLGHGPTNMKARFFSAANAVIEAITRMGIRYFIAPL